MDTLATVKDLDSYGIEYADGKLAGKLLESVSAAVRDAAGCPITHGDFPVTIPGETSRRPRPAHAPRDFREPRAHGRRGDRGLGRLLGNALYRESLLELAEHGPLFRRRHHARRL